jgi:hypothetical protein
MQSTLTRHEDCILQYTDYVKLLHWVHVISIAIQKLFSCSLFAFCFCTKTSMGVFRIEEEFKNGKFTVEDSGVGSELPGNYIYI